MAYLKCSTIENADCIAKQHRGFVVGSALGLWLVGPEKELIAAGVDAKFIVRSVSYNKGENDE